MSCFEIMADIFTRLSVFDLPEGSSNSLKIIECRPVFLKDAAYDMYILCIRDLDFLLTASECFSLMLQFLNIKMFSLQCHLRLCQARAGYS